MCDGKTSCQKPKALRGKPQDCLRDQIMKCHGEVKKHPCLKSARSK